MESTIIKKVVNFCDTHNKVLRIFCDNSIIHYYNAKHNKVVFDYDNEVFYSYRLSIENNQMYINPYDIDIIRFDEIQGFRISVTEDEMIASVTEMGVNVDTDELIECMNYKAYDNIRRGNTKTEFIQSTMHPTIEIETVQGKNSLSTD